MRSADLKDLAIKISSLTLFSSLKRDPVVSALKSYLDVFDRDTECAVSAYSEIATRLFSEGEDDLALYIRDIVANDENIYMVSVGKGEKPSSAFEASLLCELSILGEVASLTPDTLRAPLAWSGYLPEWKNTNVDLAADYKKRTDDISKYGYGMYAKYHTFYIDQSSHIVPVKNPDKTRLSELIGYAREKRIILDNTRALLEGKPAANILLTGDAGTGKSSTVKAVVNELYPEGLRILEIRKEQLSEIPAILDELTQNPLKFIIFIDDLSFGKDDDNFSALKAMLEGSVSAKSNNVVIYATSNRRHLVKEKFSDRQGDDVHFNDTLQEIISLSERFGIQLTFARPDKNTYLDIVHHLLEGREISMTPEELDIAAERFALMRGTRSARAAKQFADGIVAGVSVDLK